MPSQFDPLAAGVIHCPEDFDTELAGIPNVIVGTALRSVNLKPTRQTTTLLREYGQEFFHSQITPSLTADVDGYDMLADGDISNAPVGKPLTRAQVAQFADGDDYGFSTSSGYFFVSDTTPTREAGSNPRGNKTTLKLVFAATASVNHVTDPGA